MSDPNPANAARICHKSHADRKPHERPPWSMVVMPRGAACLFAGDGYGIISLKKMGKVEKALLVTTALGCGAFMVWVFSPAHNTALEGVSSALGQILISVVTSIYGLRIAANRAFPHGLRQAYGLFALSGISIAIAVLLQFHDFAVTGTFPSPSVADGFYLLAYPLALGAILSFPFLPPRQEQRLLLSTDATIVVLVSAVFLWYFEISGLISKGVSGLPDLISIGYPLGDLLLLTGLASMIQRSMDTAWRTAVLLVTSGMVVFIFGDILYAILLTNAVDSNSAIFQVPSLLILIGRLGFMAATLWQAGQTKIQRQGNQDESFSPLLRTNLVYICVPAGIGLTFAAMASLAHLNLRLYGTLVGTVGIMTLVLVRQYFVLQDNRHLQREVEKLAVTDALTGLANRRFFAGALEKEIARAKRYQRPLSVFVIDIDNFKKYNDRFGHSQGDKLLVDFADLLKTKLRVNDLSARYGGDEFVVLLPETDLQKAGVVAEKLRQAVKGDLNVLGEAVGISIGCAGFQPPDMTAETLLGLADQDMYRQKPQHARR